MILTFWYGLEQEEVADIFGCTQENVCLTLGGTMRTLKNILKGTYKKPSETAVGI